MCGIVGITYFNKERNVEQSLLKQMLDLIRHRGPDDEGTYIDHNVGIGMRRLSIIDLSGGHQPISNEDQSIWIVFNGEIYNFAELKDNLIKKGHKFTTNTDTEVIIHQYEEDGENCVHKFNGMFAFCIWDKKINRLFISRDRMGVKPLYYYLDDKLFMFSSEIKTMFAAKEIKKDVDLQALYDYLTFRYVPVTRTMFAGINKLPAGHNLMVDLTQRKINVSQYWDLKFSEPTKILSETEYLEQFSSLFRDAVKKRLISDVPLGVLLSGGLDSTAVTVAMNELGISKIKTFSVGFDTGGIYDESNYAETVTKHLGLENKKIVIGLKEFTDFLPQYVWYLDEPIADLASVPLYYVNKLARKDVTVVLSGEGSDELLAGYDFDRTIKRIDQVKQFLKIPQVLRRDIPVTLFRSLGFKSFADKLDRINLPLNRYSKERLFPMTNIFSDADKKRVLAKQGSWTDSLNILRQLYADSGTDDPLNQILYVYWKSWLPEDLLNKADKMSMANSIELRVPFLDYRLVELVASFPTTIKVGKDQQGNYHTKYVLRKMLENKIPREIVYRSKLGFPVPAYQWLKKELNSYCKDVLFNSTNSQFFNKKEIENLFVKLNSDNSNETAAKIWNLMVFELWYQKYFVNN